MIGGHQRLDIVDGYRGFEGGRARLQNGQLVTLSERASCITRRAARADRRGPRRRPGRIAGSEGRGRGQHDLFGGSAGVMTQSTFAEVVQGHCQAHGRYQAALDGILQVTLAASTWPQRSRHIGPCAGTPAPGAWAARRTG